MDIQTLFSNRKSMKTILVYNPFSGTGHHESWTSLVCRILLERSYRVVCLTPSTEVVTRALSALDSRLLQNLQVISCQLPSTVISDKVNQTPSSRWSGVRTYIRDLFSIYAHGNYDVLVPKSLPLRKRLKRGIAFVLVRSTHLFMKLLGIVGLVSRTEVGLIHPKFFLDCVNEAQEKARWKPNLLFVMYMDTFMQRRSSWYPFCNSFPLPFGGISFDSCYQYGPGKNLEEPYWKMTTFRGLCMTDERKQAIYASAHPDKTFVTIPDITNHQLLEPATEIVRDVQKRANGRTVVMLGGSIEVRKNVTLFLRIAANANPKRWFFVLAGELHLREFTPEEQAFLKQIATAQDGHIYACFQFFNDERELNTLFYASDIIFAVYQNFRKSSNLITKAAFLEKPILVSDRYLMGERVRRYGIGLAVPEDDPAVALDCLEQLRQQPISQDSFAAYRADHNESAMGEALEEFITAALRTEEVKE